MTAEYLSDDNGNRAYIEYFGSAEKAQEALDSLQNCRNCWNCSHCSGCSRCSDCSNKKEAPLEIPAIPEIHKAIYAAASRPDALNMRNWHTCETTHCRAGWVVTLAGEAGKALETRFNTEMAAMLIYCESGYDISPGNFYWDIERSLEDMRRLAQGDTPREGEKS